MKKIIIACFLIFGVLNLAIANHIKGGFFTYKYLGAGSTSGSLKYEVTLTVYMECFPQPGQLNQEIDFTIFNAGSNIQYRNEKVTITQTYELNQPVDDECITGDQTGCYYTIVKYTKTIDLPSNAEGYTISYQRCCRIPGVENIQNSSSIGNTYSITIPGSSAPHNAQTNNSATFEINDLAVVCRNSYFTIPFVATDADNDVLTYSFCDAWVGGDQTNPSPQLASSPPYQTLPYLFPFNGSNPLGQNVTINSQTGLISGIAPNISGSGEFVITVCVNEFRNGVLIATTRKELHIRVGTCSPITPQLEPSYISCDGFNIDFNTNNPNPIIKTFLWDFGDGQTSTEKNPSHTYADTGTYNVKVVVNKGLGCEDEAITIAKVYPGFFPDFTASGICVTKPTQFTDNTTADYGIVDSWNWDFGESSVNNDVSDLQNPAFTYPSMGTKNIRLIATSTKGCIDTIIKPVAIIDRPPLSVAFSDTLICAGDILQLEAIGNGVFSWTPGITITNANTATPTVNPANTTKYNVQLNDNGCINFDSVNVNVVDFVTLVAMPDTLICSGDAVQLNAVTNGLQFMWTGNGTLNDPNILNPVAIPVNTTNYQIISTIGGCNAADEVLVTLVPYPIANAGPDTLICYESSAQLNGSANGTSFTWTPGGTLDNPNILNPISTPPSTTNYVLAAFDTQGCPKPGYDTVVITVLPPMGAFAGNDTAVVIGQPLQFNAIGGVTYTWQPGTGLNDPTIPNPIGIYDGSFDSIRYQVSISNLAGCTETAFISVKIYNVEPQVFVPTAFTPNGDGRNDLFRPIAVGMKSFDFFRVYNRWGQMIFSTTVSGQGWDGRIKGNEQGTNSFVWIVQGTDYLDRPFFKKGMVTLIR
ncbi:MAG: PKD domain-containing protein [Chitinophagaceae bacterium]|nr:PKD domain-containing protein [Chitinophagaceae bacterium]